MISPIKVFYCYAREDKAFRDELEKHLRPLKPWAEFVETDDGEYACRIPDPKHLHATLKESNPLPARFKDAKYCELTRFFVYYAMALLFDW